MKAIRKNRPMMLILIAGSICVAFAGLVLVILEKADGRGDVVVVTSGSQLCAARMNVRGIPFFESADELVWWKRASRVGRGRRPACSEDDPASGSSQKVKGEEVAVYEVQGVSAELALIAEDEPSLIYILGNRCVVADKAQALELCLRQPLDYQGSLYTETTLDQEVSVEHPLGEARRRLCCGNEATRIEIAAITNVRPEVAVANAAEPETIYLTGVHCATSTWETLLSCLQEA